MIERLRARNEWKFAGVRWGFARPKYALGSRPSQDCTGRVQLFDNGSFYWHRSARIGSTWAARRDGIQAARAATATISNPAAKKLSGSFGLIPYNDCWTSFVSASAAGIRN